MYWILKNHAFKEQNPFVPLVSLKSKLPVYDYIYMCISPAATLEIVGGSGYFHVASSDASLAEIEYDVSRPREVVTTPALDGDLVIEAFDLCVDGSVSAKTHVHIAGKRLGSSWLSSGMNS